MKQVTTMPDLNDFYIYNMVTSGDSGGGGSSGNGCGSGKGFGCGAAAVILCVILFVIYLIGKFFG